MTPTEGRVPRLVNRNPSDRLIYSYDGPREGIEVARGIRKNSKFGDDECNLKGLLENGSEARLARTAGMSATKQNKFSRRFVNQTEIPPQPCWRDQNEAMRLALPRFVMGVSSRDNSIDISDISIVVTKPLHCLLRTIGLSCVAASCCPK